MRLGLSLFFSLFECMIRILKSRLPIKFSGEIVACNQIDRRKDYVTLVGRFVPKCVRISEDVLFSRSLVETKHKSYGFLVNRI